MNNIAHSIAPLIGEYRSLELDAHVSLDDAIMKVSEENYELQIAIWEHNILEIKSEAQDVLINILSVSSRLIDIENLSSRQEADLSSIDALVALWIRQTAILRWRYSRGKVSIQEYVITTSHLVSSLIQLIDNANIVNVISASVEKFRNRTKEYLPNISLRDHIDSYPDFPKPGILFRDIAPLLVSPEALRYAGFEIAKHAKDADVIVGLDARGFIFGTLVAQILDKPFMMIRKKWKLPGETIGRDYSLEYGSNSIEIQKDVIKDWDKVAVIDDLLATGGTLGAAAELIEKVWGKIESLICLIRLDDPLLLDLPSRKALSKYKVETILQY